MRVETKVGLLTVASFALIVVFVYMMGLVNPFSDTNEIYVMYNYAGGIEEGSPLRVMGIKVGKVKKIAFDPTYKSPEGEEVKLRITVSIDKKAWSSVRKKSKFFINLAGVIGEKFLEVTPGPSDSPEFTPGETVRGEDPPRIDQLISQGYGLAGKFMEIVDKNEGSVTNLIKQLDHLVVNFNKTLVLIDKTTKNKDIARLLENTVKISDDLLYLTGKLRSKPAEDTYDLVHKLLFRLDPMDGPMIRKFLQQEGIKARLF